jgi:ankyrin repeat protein
MVRYMIDRGCLVKSVMFYVMLFFLPLLCMDGKKQFANCGLSSLLVPRDVIRQHIKPALSFQDVGRLKQVSKACNKYWSMRRICPTPQGCACICPVLACRKLVGNFDACTKALVHCAEKNNERMFQHLWNHDSVRRDKSVCAWFKTTRPSVRDRMDMCRGACYSKNAMIEKSVKKLKIALQQKNTDTAKAVLLSHKFCPFAVYEDTQENVFFSSVCSVRDLDLFLLFLGKNFRVNRVDKHQKTALHYVAEHGTAEMVDALIKIGSNVNAVDIDGCTPLHYACRRSKRDGEIMRLLLKNGADCDVLDNKGNRALDF